MRKLNILIALKLFIAISTALFVAPQLQAEDLIAKVDGSKPTTYSLNYQEYPGLVAAFLYIAQQEPELYQELQYKAKDQSSYGKAFSSLPSQLYSLPNIPSVSHPQPGLAFWRNGSVLRSDILVRNNAAVGIRDQKNLVFFADLQQAGTSNRKKGLKLIDVEARSPSAKNFLAKLSRDRKAYMESLESLWRENLSQTAPEVLDLLEQSDAWQRDAFGYYTRTIIHGKGNLPRDEEDLNITLERKAFVGIQAQSLPVIVNFGRDALPMPFAHFVARTPKGSRVEILCPPSAARRALSNLPAEYGSTRYQWLLSSYAQDAWVYLSFSLEIL